MCDFVVVVCYFLSYAFAFFVCLLPCLNILKFLRCSFVDVSCTPAIGVSEINSLT